MAGSRAGGGAGRAQVAQAQVAQSPVARARTPKKSEVVAQAIVHDVVRRRLRPGDRLASEIEMMDDYGVGRASLREGLRILELNGLITIKPGPGGGPFVNAVSARTLGQMLTLHFHVAGATYRELMQARLTLEPVCAGLAAARDDDVVAARLGAVAERAVDVDVLDDYEYRAMSRDFHGTVASLSGNRVLDLMAHALMEIFDAHIARATHDAGTRRAVPDEHDRVTEAILAHDAELAEARMREHMERYADVFARSLPGLLDEPVEWTT